MRAPVVSPSRKVLRGLATLFIALVFVAAFCKGAIDEGHAEALGTSEVSDGMRSVGGERPIAVAAAASTPSKLLATSIAREGIPLLSGEVPLASDPASFAYGSSVTCDGFVYSLVTADGSTTASLVGTVSVEGDVVIPREIELDGSIYLVTRVTVGAIESGLLSSVTIPDTVTQLDDGALSKARHLKAIHVADNNPNYSSYDGMLFDADQLSLLLIPEGKQGAARIPKTASTVPPSAFSHCAGVTSIEVEAGSAAFSSRNGCLYDVSGETLLRVPAGLGNEAAIAQGCARIAAGAFEGCDILLALDAPTSDLMVVEGKFDASVEETEEALRILSRKGAGSGPSPDGGLEESGTLRSSKGLLARALAVAVSDMPLAAKAAGAAASTSRTSQVDGDNVAREGQAFALAFSLSENPSHQGVDGAWPQGYAPPSSLRPSDGDVVIANPVRTGYRFLGWANSPLLIERKEGGRSVIHADSMSGDTTFVAYWSFNVSVDVPSIVSFSYENVPEKLGVSSEGFIRDGEGLCTSFVNRSSACSLRVVGLSSEASADAPSVIRAKPESGKTNEEALQLRLLSMYPAGHADDSAKAVSFRLQDMIGEEEFQEKGPQAFLVPKGDGVVGSNELRVGYRLNLDDWVEGQPEPNFAMVDGAAALDSEKGLATLSYVIATAASQDGPAYYDVTWDGNGGSFNGDAAKKALQVTNSLATTAPQEIPERTGYSFKGWAASKMEADDGKEISSFPSVTVSDATYYAIWEGVSCTVRWNAYYGSVSSGKSVQEAKYGDALDPPSVFRSGYTLLGWSETAGATEPDSGLGKDDIAKGTVTKTVEYYAVWGKNPTITWDAMGGSWKGDGPGDVERSKVTYVDYGGKTVAPSEAPARDGCAFGGWAASVEDAYSKVQCIFPDQTIKDASYYAIWKAIPCTVRWNSYYGSVASGESVQEAKYGDALEPPSVFRSGYTLLGWSETAGATEPDSGLGKDDIAKGTVTKTVEYYAVWGKNPTITWDAMGGSWRDPETLGKQGSIKTVVTYGDKTDEPKTETDGGQAILMRPGYVFKGWATKKESSDVTAMPSSTTSDSAYYAVWELGPSATGIASRDDLYHEETQPGSSKIHTYSLADVKAAAHDLASYGSEPSRSPFFNKYKGFLDQGTCFWLKVGSLRYEVQILGICQDMRPTGVAAGLTFGFKNLYAWDDRTSSGEIFETSMNSLDSNAGGWSGSELRSRLQNDFFQMLGADMRNDLTGIIPVVKTHQYPGDTASHYQTTQDTIFIPSLYEAYGVALASSNSSEGIAKPGPPSYYRPFQYQYFQPGKGEGTVGALNNKRVMRSFNGVDAGWWFRSARQDTTAGFSMTGVGAAGDVGNSANASVPLGVLPCFCL